MGNGTLETVRKILLVIIVASLIGTEAELIMLGHFAHVLQLVPVGLIAVGLVALVWFVSSRNSKSLRVFHATMFLCVFSGFLGIVLHLAYDISTVTEKNKGIQGFELLWAALKSVAPPIAPGAMIQIGLVGLAYTYRHPALDARER